MSHLTCQELENQVDDLKKQLNLKNIKWEKLDRLLQGDSDRQDSPVFPSYDDLTELNTSRLILDSVGKNTLKNVVQEHLDLLETSVAIYELNGDCALGIFSSCWCHFLDNASRKLCNTKDNHTALNSGKWLCHESCWHDASKASIEKKAPVDVECNGGIHLYAVPIWANNKVVGSINFGYGDPPGNPEKLRQIAELYQVDFDELSSKAKLYDTRPPFIIEFAKKRLLNVASIIGNIIENTMVRKKETDEKYKNIIELSMDGYSSVDNAANFLDVNDSYCKMLGYSRDELLKMNVMDIDAAMSPEEIEKNINNLITKGYDRFETKLRQKDGNIIDVEISSTFAPKDERLFFSFIRDITARKLTEETLRNNRDALEVSESRASALLNAIPDLMFRLDKDAVFLDYQADKSDLYTLADTIIGNKVSDLLPAEMANLIEQKIKQTLNSDEIQILEYQLPMPELGVTNYEARMVNCDGNEVIAIVRNVTDRKRAEEEKTMLETQLHQGQKMEAIGLMAGGVAHDLNNILAGITGYPELLLLQLPEESNLRKPIEAIKEAGERATLVVADLLTVARGVASARTITNLNTLVAEYFDSPEYRHLHSLHPQVQYHQLLADDLLNISCSPVHIKKCIMNLVTNAAESIDKSGSITLSTNIVTPDRQWFRENGLKQMQYAVLMITDTGTGIPEKDIDHIFEPFYTKKVMGRSGTGLGLTVVWNTVREHDGTVTVTTSDQGTSFELFFPVTEDLATDSVSTENESHKGSGEKILVVDDEPQLRDIAGSMLEVLGYQVICLSSGEEAIAYLQDHQVELVLLDMLMEPGINGRQAYEQIVNLHPGQKAIITSGFTESDDVKETLNLGASGFVKKPYSMDQLGRAVKEALIC